jgi:hypothetical protein
MRSVRTAVESLTAEIALLTCVWGREVNLDASRVTDRSDAIALKPPGLWSSNRSCRLLRTLDGWIAANLPRPSDLSLVPAWIGCDLDAEPWAAVVTAAARSMSSALLAQARLLGLAAAGLGEVTMTAGAPNPPVHRMAGGRWRCPGQPVKVIDMSSLWAGPLCGAILADMGADVVRVESWNRPDSGRYRAPAQFTRLNGAKRSIQFDFATPADLNRLRDLIATTDILITSARPRAFESLELSPEQLFASNSGLVWVAITGYGWFGADADRVAFGDDASVAGGLVRWTKGGQPRFLGDALADPLTGLASVVGALSALETGGGVLVDAALARTAADVR